MDLPWIPVRSGGCSSGGIAKERPIKSGGSSSGGFAKTPSIRSLNVLGRLIRSVISIDKDRCAKRKEKREKMYGREKSKYRFRFISPSIRMTFFSIRLRETFCFKIARRRLWGLSEFGTGDVMPKMFPQTQSEFSDFSDLSTERAKLILF